MSIPCPAIVEYSTALYEVVGSHTIGYLFERNIYLPPLRPGADVSKHIAEDLEVSYSVTD